MNQKWTLLEHGDSLERQYWLIFKERFPNYEIFWSNFIVPLTGRPNNLNDIQFKKGIDPLLEGMAMTHYSIFRSLCYIFDEKQMYRRESLKNIYIHLRIITDLVELLATHLINIKIKIGKCEPLEMLTKNKFLTMAEEYFLKHYEKQFNKFKEVNNPVTFYVHGKRNIIKEFVKDDDFNKIEKLFTGIRRYSNFLIHMPAPGTVYLKFDTGYMTLMAIKKDKIDKYDLWTTILYNRDYDDLIEQSILVEDDFKEIQIRLNEIWKYFINEMEIISKHREYNNLISDSETNMQTFSTLTEPVSGSAVHRDKPSTSGSDIF